MRKSRIPDGLRAEIVAQFGSRCAYCQTQQQISGIRLTVDHIVPEALGGTTEKRNLCLACDHFEWSSDGSLMLGKTTVGRVSISALRTNRAELVISRKLWTEVGWHPPD